MSGVRNAMSLSPQPGVSGTDVRVMQDVLYDILATGVDPEHAHVPLETVERFLHEHARTAKSSAEFAAFFAKHGLTASARASRPAAAVALPPIQRVVQPEAPVLRFPVELGRQAESDTSPSIQLSFAVDPPPAKRTRSWGSRIALALLAAAVLGLGALSYVALGSIAELRGQLANTHQEAQRDRKALVALEHQQVDIESNVAASAQLIDRMDQKSDLILETLQPQSKYSRRR